MKRESFEEKLAKMYPPIRDADERLIRMLIDEPFHRASGAWIYPNDLSDAKLIASKFNQEFDLGMDAKKLHLKEWGIVIVYDWMHGCGRHPERGRSGRKGERTCVVMPLTVVEAMLAKSVQDVVDCKDPNENGYPGKTRGVYGG